MSLETILKHIADVSLVIHISAGLGSIILFWIPIFTKKGSKVHRKIGKTYIFLMWVVIFSSIVLIGHKLFEGELNAAIFLGFLVFLAARPIWYGIAILKPKQYTPQQLKYYHIVLKLILFFYGVFMLVYATYSQDHSVKLLMFAFGTLGVLAGWDAWQDFRKPSASSKIQGHFEGMLFSGVAAYTAFLTFGGYGFIEKYMVGYWLLIPWLSPSIIGMVLIFFYKKRFS
jgi:uncharacterized membrane protein